MRILDWGKKQREFQSVAFDATGQLLAGGGGYQTTVVWDVATGAERARFQVVTRWVQFHPFSGQLILSTNSEVLLGDANSGTTNVALAHYAGGLALAPNEEWVAYFHTSGDRARLSAATRLGATDQAPLWDVALGDSVDEAGYTTCLVCLSDGERFISAEHLFKKGSYLNSRRRIAIRSRVDGRVLQSWDKAFGYGDLIFASHHSDNVIVLDGKSLRVHLIDDPLDELNAPRILKNDNRKHFTGIAFHPSGKYLAATSNDATVKLYDTTTWEVARTFTWDIGRMRSIAFSPDGALAAAGSDSGKVVVWDVDL